MKMSFPPRSTTRSRSWWTSWKSLVAIAAAITKVGVTSITSSGRTVPAATFTAGPPATRAVSGPRRPGRRDQVRGLPDRGPGVFCRHHALTFTQETPEQRPPGLRAPASGLAALSSSPIVPLSASSSVHSAFLPGQDVRAFGHSASSKIRTRYMHHRPAQRAAALGVPPLPVRVAATHLRAAHPAAIDTLALTKTVSPSVRAPPPPRWRHGRCLPRQ
jgi:hypothetical protein